MNCDQCEIPDTTIPAIPAPVLEHPIGQFPAITEQTVPTPSESLADTGDVYGDLFLPGVLLIVGGVMLLRLEVLRRLS